jgi:hypothetical protein
MVLDGLNSLGAAHLSIGKLVEGCQSGFGGWQPFQFPLMTQRVDGTNHRVSNGARDSVKPARGV